MKPRPSLFLSVCFLFLWSGMSGCGGESATEPEEPKKAGKPETEDAPKDGKTAVINISGSPNWDELIGEEEDFVAVESLDRVEGYPVVICAVDPLVDINAELQELIESGTKVVVVGSTNGGTRPPCTTWVRPRNREIGALAGRWIIQELARRSELSGRAAIEANVVQIRASDDDPASVQRYEGFIEYMDLHYGVVFVHDGPGFWTKEDAKLRMEEALRIQKGIGVVFAHSDLMAEGAGEAIQKWRKENADAGEILLLGVGGNSDGLDGSISLKPLMLKAVEVARKMASDAEFEPQEEIMISPTEVEAARGE